MTEVTDEPGRVRRAWRAFRRWRRTRPFWGGLLVTLGGLEILASERAPLPLIIHIGLQGIAGYLIPIILVLCGLLLLFHPVQRLFYSLIAIVFSLGSWVTSNLGGFIVGMLLGLIGGSLAFAWVQRDRREQVRRRDAPPPKTTTSVGIDLVRSDHPRSDQGGRRDSDRGAAGQPDADERGTIGRGRTWHGTISRARTWRGAISRGTITGAASGPGRTWRGAIGRPVTSRGATGRVGTSRGATGRGRAWRRAGKHSAGWRGPFRRGPFRRGPAERAPAASGLVERAAGEGRSVEGRSVEGRSVEGRSVEGRSVEGRRVGRRPKGRKPVTGSSGAAASLPIPLVPLAPLTLSVLAALAARGLMTSAGQVPVLSAVPLLTSSSPVSTPTLSPSFLATPSPSVTPSVRPSATPTTDPSPVTSPSPSASPSATPSPAPSRPVLKAGLPIAPVAGDRVELTALSAVLNGVSYDGVASVPTVHGRKLMLKFTMSYLKLPGIMLTATQGGQSFMTRDSTLELSGHVVLYTTSITGTLNGIRVTFTASDPPSSLRSDLTLANVVAEQLFVTARTVQAIDSQASSG